MIITMVISARQTGHPAAISDTRIAQDSQNRAYVRTAPVRSQHVAPRGTLRTSRQRLTQPPPLLIPTPLKSPLLARTPDWPRPRLAAAVTFPSQSPPSHTSVRVAAPVAVLSGTLLHTVRSSSGSATSTRNTLETRNQQRGQTEETADNKSSAPL